MALRTVAMPRLNIENRSFVVVSAAAGGDVAARRVQGECPLAWWATGGSVGTARGVDPNCGGAGKEAVAAPYVSEPSRQEV